MMFDHALVSSQVVPVLDAWLFFLSPSLWCGSYCIFHLETCLRLH